MTRYVVRASTDAVLIVYAYTGSGVLRVLLGAPYESLRTLAYCLAPFVLLHIAALIIFEGYDFSRLRSESDVAYSALLGSVAGTVLSFVGSTTYILYYAPDTQVVGRSVFLLAGISCALVLPGWRVWYTRLRRRRGELDTRIIALGSRARVRALARELSQYSRSGHHVVGCVVLEEDLPEPDGEGAYLGTLKDLGSLIREHDVQEVLVGGQGLARDPAKLMEVISACEEAGVVAHVLPGEYEAIVGKLDLYEIGGLPLIELRRRPMSVQYAFLKRVMDVAGAAVLLVLLSPVLLAAMVAIKLDTRGSVFYSQVRSGRNGRHYHIHKLRTMRQDAEQDTGPVWALKEDPRVTRVGRFLRHKRIDEIPQLWNVLKGDMSLVGPRPERPFFIEQFRKDIPLFPLRLRVRPGVTSLSHVWGRYDSCPAHRLLYDLVYMSNISLMLDLRILTDTVKIVLTGRGAQ